MCRSVCVCGFDWLLCGVGVCVWCLLFVVCRLLRVWLPWLLFVVCCVVFPVGCLVLAVCFVFVIGFCLLGGVCWLFIVLCVVLLVVVVCRGLFGVWRSPCVV